MDTFHSMPLSRTAFCYIDDGMEQFGSYNIFYKRETKPQIRYEKGKEKPSHILFIDSHIFEFLHIFIFQLRSETQDLMIVYRETEFGSPKTLILKPEKNRIYGAYLPDDIELIEFYEWLRERLFSSPTHPHDESSCPSLQPQTCPSPSCIPALPIDSPSLPLPTLPWTQSDPTCSSSNPSS